MKTKTYSAIGYRQIDFDKTIYDIVIECMVHEDIDSISVDDKYEFLLVYPIPNKQDLKYIRKYIDDTFWLDEFKWNKEALNR